MNEKVHYCNQLPLAKAMLGKVPLENEGWQGNGCAKGGGTADRPAASDEKRKKA